MHLDRIRPREPYFDPETGAWMLTRFSDVEAALRHGALGVTGAEFLDTQRGAARAHAQADFTASSTLEWRDIAACLATDVGKALRSGETIDLVRDFADPWSLALAESGASSDSHAHIVELSRRVFNAAAHATCGEVQPAQLDAISELSAALSSPSAPSRFAVQSFVALSQTLPCLLAAAWLALLENPGELELLRSDQTLISSAIEELLRFAGPSRALFRVAQDDLHLGSARIERGQRVTLCVAAANRDPERFVEPDRLTLTRRPVGHLAFGRGEHACVGASVIRDAVATATAALLPVLANAALAGEVEWLGGYAIDAPLTLPVCLRSDRAGG